MGWGVGIKTYLKQETPDTLNQTSAELELKPQAFLAPNLALRPQKSWAQKDDPRHLIARKKQELKIGLPVPHPRALIQFVELLLIKQ